MVHNGYTVPRIVTDVSCLINTCFAYTCTYRVLKEIVVVALKPTAAIFYYTKTTPCGVAVPELGCTREEGDTAHNRVVHSPLRPLATLSIHSPTAWGIY